MLKRENLNKLNISDHPDLKALIMTVKIQLGVNPNSFCQEKKIYQQTTTPQKNYRKTKNVVQIIF